MITFKNWIRVHYLNLENQYLLTFNIAISDCLFMLLACAFYCKRLVCGRKWNQWRWFLIVKNGVLGRSFVGVFYGFVIWFLCGKLVVFAFVDGRGFWMSDCVCVCGVILNPTRPALNPTRRKWFLQWPCEGRQKREGQQSPTNV